MSIFFQKDYSTYITEELNNWVVWEIEIFLNTAPESDIGYIILEKGVAWQEETIFYHRRAGNSVFCYGVNRSNPVTHPVNSTASNREPKILH